MTLILLRGLPKSGKTTWAREQNHPIVNPDSIRKALHGERYIEKAEPFVWAIAYCMVEALFLAGHDTVIVDACNNTQKRVDEWKNRFEGYQIDIHDVSTGALECIERAKALGDLEIIPVIERMANERGSL